MTATFALAQWPIFDSVVETLELRDTQALLCACRATYQHYSSLDLLLRMHSTLDAAARHNCLRVVDYFLDRRDWRAASIEEQAKLLASVVSGGHLRIVDSD